MTGATTPPLRLAFAGTPSFAATILSALIDRYSIATVYCQPARPMGRGRRITPSPVERLARERDIPVVTPSSMRHEAERLRALDLDALIVAAYGKMLPRDVLRVPRQGCINVHASLLPRWRGAAPIERAMLAGDEVTGISIMLMDEGLDTGPVFHRASCPILDSDTGDDLHERLALLGARTLVECLAGLPSSAPSPQSTDGVTYAPKLTPADSKIDWTRSAKSIAAQIRALNSRQPVACTVDGERLRLLFAQSVDVPTVGPPGTVIECNRSGVLVASGVGAVRISRVALSRGSGKSMDVAALLNGHPDLFRPGRSLDAA